MHAPGFEIGRERLRREEGREWLKEEAWPRGEQRRVVKSYLHLIDAATEEIREADRGIREEARASPAAPLLQTIPGIGPFRSLLLPAGLTPSSRFETPDRLASYAGLAPRTRSSGGVTRHGRTPGGANWWVRGEMVSAAPIPVRLAPESPLTKYDERQKERIGWAKARVAPARKLARVVKPDARNRGGVEELMPGGERRRPGGSSEHAYAGAFGSGASGMLTETPDCIAQS